MLKLIFFSTNRTKLAHVRYMAEGYPVSIESFRRKTFYASYTEPRIDCREELLRMSYESALEQAENSGINTKKRFFFLEDTSATVEALSTEGQEVPGVNIKYWMKDTRFKELDKVLTQCSNRHVTVRSDILLHIPETFRREWGIKENYLVFVGTQEGSVVENEQKIETNLVFPWLDNKTFNKWFVPHGEAKPLSSLPIEVADKYDFRRHAFSKMMRFFEQNGLYESSFEQRSLALEKTCQYSSPVLILCGFPCAGKTTLSQYLVREYAYIHIEASDFMYLSFYLRHDLGTGVRISDFAEEALNQKPEIAAEKVAEYIKTLDDAPIVVSGFRSIKEVEWLENELERWENSRTLTVGFIEAEQSTRFKRSNRRRRDGEGITIDRFKEQEAQQIRMGLNGILSFPNRTIVPNEGTFEEFFYEAERRLEPSNKSRHGSKIDFSIFRDHSKNIGLEAPILMALLCNWEDGEDRPYFTTTEIAKLINKLFPSMKPKHKDNVSRYFNQDFYAFYEMFSDLDENKRKYRLSNTGYGRAVSIYYRIKDGGHFP